MKVPRVTAYFWIVKILTTAIGEAISDDLVNRFNPVPVVLVAFVSFVAVLIVQLRAPRYVAWLYWTAALMVSIFGTMAADVVHVGMGIPYLVSAIGCAAALTATFVVWYRTEHTLSIHSITTLRRELFYWATAAVTFALGTAVGDLTAVTFRLGFLASGLLFIVVFALPAIGYWKFRMDSVLAFWFAYIITRPLGASFADWVAKPHAAKGLGRGDGIVVLVLATLIVGFVGYLSVSHVDDPELKETA